MAVPTRQPPGPPLWLSVPMFVVGIAVFVISVAAVTTSILHSIYDAPVFHAPGSEQLHCQPGLYAFYVEQGGGNISVGSIEVRGPAPAQTILPVKPSSTSFSFPKNGATFSGDLEFNVTASGTYSISVSSGPAAVVVAPTLTSAAESHLGWALGVVAGGLVALAGLILFIVGLVQRSKSRRAARQFAGQAWGGPPGGPWGPPGAPPGTPWGPPGTPWGPPGAPPGTPWGPPGAPPGTPWGPPTGPTPPTGWPPPPPPDPAANPESGPKPDPVGWPQPSNKSKNPSQS